MKFDTVITSIPVIKYNIHYYDGNNSTWKRALEEISDNVVMTQPEFDLDLSKCKEIYEKVDELGLDSIEDLEEMIEIYESLDIPSFYSNEEKHRLIQEIIDSKSEYNNDIEERLESIGISSVEELDNLIEEYNKMREKLEEIESLL